MVFKSTILVIFALLTSWLDIWFENERRQICNRHFMSTCEEIDLFEMLLIRPLSLYSMQSGPYLSWWRFRSKGTYIYTYIKNWGKIPKSKEESILTEESISIENSHSVPNFFVTFLFEILYVTGGGPKVVPRPKSDPVCNKEIKFIIQHRDINDNRNVPRLSNR